MTEQALEQALIAGLTDLKYTHRPDIRDRVALEANFPNHFPELNRVQLPDGEFKRLLDEIITPDVFTAGPSEAPCTRALVPGHRIAGGLFEPEALHDNPSRW